MNYTATMIIHRRLSEKVRENQNNYTVSLMTNEALRLLLLFCCDEKTRFILGQHFPLLRNTYKEKE